MVSGGTRALTVVSLRGRDDVFRARVNGACTGETGESLQPSETVNVGWVVFRGTETR